MRKNDRLLVVYTVHESSSTIVCVRSDWLTTFIPSLTMHQETTFIAVLSTFIAVLSIRTAAVSDEAVPRHEDVSGHATEDTRSPADSSLWQVVPRLTPKPTLRHVVVAVAAAQRDVIDSCQRLVTRVDCSRRHR